MPIDGQIGSSFHACAIPEHTCSVRFRPTFGHVAHSRARCEQHDFDPIDCIDANKKVVRLRHTWVEHHRVNETTSGMLRSMRNLHEMKRAGVLLLTLEIESRRSTAIMFCVPCACRMTVEGRRRQEA